MYPPFLRPASLAVLSLATGLMLLQAGCYVQSQPGYRYVAPAPQVIIQDDYVYYPEYEVYYSNTRHDYVYRDGRSWVTRPQPPRGWAQSSLSVNMSFHDAPERHHAEVIRTYPRNWKPQPSKRRDPHDDHKDDKHR
jgi:hypothetical protein